MEANLETKHKLFYLILNTVYHCLAFVYAVSSFTYYLIYYSSESTTDYQRFASIFKISNSWSLLFIITYFIIAIAVNGCMWWKWKYEAPKALLWIRDFVRSTLAIPLTFTTCVFYWGNELMKLKVVNQMEEVKLTMLLKQLVNTLPSVILTVDIIISKASYPTNQVGMITVTALMLSYAIWVHVVFLKTGEWVILLLKEANLINKIFLFVLFLLTALLFYLLGKFFTGLFWDKELCLTCKTTDLDRPDEERTVSSLRKVLSQINAMKQRQAVQAVKSDENIKK